MTSFFMSPGGGALGTGGLTPETAFDWAAFRTWTGANTPGDVCYVESGNYVANSQTLADDGTVAAPISVIGVTSLTALTPAAGTDRPLLDFSAIANNEFEVNNYWRLCCLRVLTDSAQTAIRVDTGGIVYNCEAENIGAGYAIQNGGLDGLIIECDAKSATGIAAVILGQYGSLIDCRLHDSAVGLIGSGLGIGNVLGNIFDACGMGVKLSTKDRWMIRGNTFYNGTIGVTGGSAQWCRFIGNIFHSLTTAASWTLGAEPSNYWDWNVWWNNGTDVMNVTKGPNAINADPQFSDPTLGTPAGFRVQAEVARQLGVNLFMAGAVPPSIFDGGETNISGTTDPDLSQDQLLLDGLETVTLDGSEVQNVYRLQESIDEREPTEGVYLERNVRFQFPFGSDIYPGDSQPSVGGVIVDGDSQAYRIIGIRPPKHSDFWGATTRGLVISGTYSLDSAVSLFPAVETLSAAGSTITTHPAADADFTDVPAAIQLRESDPADWAGVRQITEVYDIYVDGDVGQLNNGDVLKDQDLKVYSVISFRNRDEIGELSAIECELRNP